MTSKLNEEFYYRYVNHVEAMERISYTMDLGFGGSPAAEIISDTLIDLSNPYSDLMPRANTFHVEALEATKR